MKIALYCSLVVLDLSILAALFASAFFYETCTAIMKEKLGELDAKTKLTPKDIKDLYEYASKVDVAFDSTCPILFFILQVSIILAIYIVVQDPVNINGIFFALGNGIYTYNFITGLEECYALASKVFLKAQEECVDTGMFALSYSFYLYKYHI